MKLLVTVKSVLDYAAKIKVKPDGSAIETENIKKIANPFDEIAVEEAVRLKEKNIVSEIVCIGIGNSEIVTQITYALAMGADRGIHIKTDNYIDSDLAARIIAAIYKKETPNLVIMGKQAIDSDAGQTPQILAEILSLPQASFASKIEIVDNSATVTREVDGGLEIVKLSLPAVISTDLRLNEPRYASVIGIMQAKKKKLDVLAPSDLGINDSEAKVQIVKLYPPATRKAGKKVASVEELINALKNEAKVI